MTGGIGFDHDNGDIEDDPTPPAWSGWSFSLGFLTGAIVAAGIVLLLQAAVHP